MGTFTRWTMGALATWILVGCGGGGGGNNPPPVPAPSGLSYPATGTVVVGVAVAALTPTVTGNVTSYGVTPALPAGLSLDASTGVISGTPTAAAPDTGYVIKAANAGGSTAFTLHFAVGTINVVSGSSISRTMVAGAAIHAAVVIKPLYITISGTLYSNASDPDGAFAKAVPVTANGDGSYTLDLATSTVIGAAEYTGTVTLRLCSDAGCSVAEPVASVTASYDLNVMTPASGWPGDHLAALTAWPGVADWQTFQGNAGHTGYVPVTVSPDQLVTRWQHAVTTHTYWNSLINLATVTTSNGLFYIAGGNLLEAHRESDGSLVWQHDFSGLAWPSVNPPAVANGVVYIAAGQQTSTYMYAFDAATGAQIFQSPMSSQWENYLAPAIGPKGVYTDAGTYGGLYGFDATGQQLFFAGADQQSGWTPAVDASSVYAYTGSKLSLVDPVTGQVQGTITDPTFSNYIYIIGGSVVLGAPGSAFAANYVNSYLNGGAIGNTLLHFNTKAMSVDWQAKGDYPATPAYKSGVLYAVNNNPLRLEARSETDGSLLWSWAPPATGDTGFASEVLVTNNLAFVSTNLSTYAIDLDTHEAVWSYPVSGNLALSSDGVLYLESKSTLTAINAK